MPVFSNKGKHENKETRFGFHKYEIYMMVAMIAFLIIVSLACFAPKREQEADICEESPEIQEIVEKPSERKKTALKSIVKPSEAPNIMVDELGEEYMILGNRIPEIEDAPEEEIVEVAVDICEESVAEVVWTPIVEEPIVEDVVEESAVEEIAEEIVRPDEPAAVGGYSERDIMSVTNMVFGEISAFIYDKNLSEEEKDFILQEWACVPLNHLKMGLASSLWSLMSEMTAGGYYIWHPQYGTEWYRNQAIAEDSARYERCRENVLKVLGGQVGQPIPENVIYADLAIHGSGVYKQYNLNTGWYQATVYLCFA